MKRVLCIWLPEWPSQRLVVARPELARAPLVLHARDPRRGRLVMACCARAKEWGVIEGMPLAEVAALQRQAASRRQDRTSTPRTSTNASPATRPPMRDPGGVLADTQPTLAAYEPTPDKQALEALAVWCEQFSPIVGLEQVDHPSSLLLDVTGLGPLFGSESQLVQRVKQAFGQRGYHVQIAAADTVGAAWALAHYGEQASTLSQLPIEALRLAPEIVVTLQQLGIETIASLLQLPRQALAIRFGDALIKRIDQCFDRQAEVIVAHRPPPRFEAAWQLEHPTGRREVVDEILWRLTQQVAADLARHDHAAVQAAAAFEGETLVSRLPVSLFQPSSHARHLYELFQLGLETLQMREPVKQVRVTAVATVRITADQQTLWKDLPQQTGRDMATLVDRLSSRLGAQQVFGVCPQAGALPERAYRRTGLTALARKKIPRGADQFTPRPLWLHQPQPLEMLASVTSAAGPGGPPSVFRFQQQKHVVARHWGPERIETGWWRGVSVRRDYYRVETNQGYRFWLFRDLSAGGWFLHGCFE